MSPRRRWDSSGDSGLLFRFVGNGIAFIAIVEYDEGDVVVLAAFVMAGPMGQVGEERGGEGVGRHREMRLQKLLNTDLPVFFIRGVHGLERAVGVEKKAVTRAKWNLDSGVGRFGEH